MRIPSSANISRQVILIEYLRTCSPPRSPRCTPQDERDSMKPQMPPADGSGLSAPVSIADGSSGSTARCEIEDREPVHESRTASPREDGTHRVHETRTTSGHGANWKTTINGTRTIATHETRTTAAEGNWEPRVGDGPALERPKLIRQIRKGQLTNGEDGSRKRRAPDVHVSGARLPNVSTSGSGEGLSAPSTPHRDTARCAGSRPCGRCGGAGSRCGPDMDGPAIREHEADGERCHPAGRSPARRPA